MEERARHVQKAESPRLRWHRQCISTGMKGRKFKDRAEVSKAMAETAKTCALKNPFPPKKKD